MSLKSSTFSDTKTHYALPVRRWLTAKFSHR